MAVSTKEFLEIWVKGANEGKSAEEIAAMFGDGRSKASVSVQASQLRNKFTQRVDDEIAKQEKAGNKLTKEQIAEMYAMVERRVPCLKRGRKKGSTNTANEELTQELSSFLSTLNALKGVDNAEVKDEVADEQVADVQDEVGDNQSA